MFRSVNCRIDSLSFLLNINGHLAFSETIVKALKFVGFLVTTGITKHRC